MSDCGVTHEAVVESRHDFIWTVRRDYWELEAENLTVITSCIMFLITGGRPGLSIGAKSSDRGVTHEAVVESQ